MTNITMGLEKTEEEILAFEVSDEALGPNGERKPKKLKREAAVSMILLRRSRQHRVFSQAFDFDQCG
jgi:hypothetical protein